MKSSRNQTNKQSKQGMSHMPKPEIRDDLDSRKKKEPTQVDKLRAISKKKLKEKKKQ